MYRPSNGIWYLDKNGSGTWSGCAIDGCVGPFGVKGDVPVVGDRSGDGRKKIGVYRPSNATWYLDANGNGAWDGCAIDRCAGPYGIKGDVPVVGKW